MRTTPHPTLALLVAIPAALVAGCGSPAATICADSCDCSGCAPLAHDLCVSSLEASDKLSNDVGCGALASAYESCVASQSQCFIGFYSAGHACDLERKDLDACLEARHCHYDGIYTVSCK